MDVLIEEVVDHLDGFIHNVVDIVFVSIESRCKDDMIPAFAIGGASALVDIKLIVLC